MDEKKPVPVLGVEGDAAAAAAAAAPLDLEEGVVFEDEGFALDGVRNKLLTAPLTVSATPLSPPPSLLPPPPPSALAAFLLLSSFTFCSSKANPTVSFSISASLATSSLI